MPGPPGTFLQQPRLSRNCGCRTLIRAFFVTLRATLEDHWLDATSKYFKQARTEVKQAETEPGRVDPSLEQGSSEAVSRTGRVQVCPWRRWSPGAAELSGWTLLSATGTCTSRRWPRSRRARPRVCLSSENVTVVRTQ